MRARWINPLMLLALVLAGQAWAGTQKSGGPPRAHGLPVNDQCSGGYVIPCGNIVLPDTARGDVGNTAEALNNYTFLDTTGCTGHLADGRDLVYKLNVGPGDSLWLDYRNRTDGSVYIVTDCGNIQGTCVAGADETFEPDQIESIRYRFTTGGLYYLILDSFGLNSGNIWSAAGQLVCGPSTPPSNDLCETATLLSCGTFNLSGSNQFAFSNYGQAVQPLTCTGQRAAGPDVVYKLVVTAGDSLSLNYSSAAFNASAYIVSDCGDAEGSCLVGADLTGIGGTEQIRYRFNFAGTYYLILDGRTAGQFGNWTATGNLVCANPPPLNDRCVDALNVNYGYFSWSGTTTFAVNDYYFGEGATCTGYDAYGRDVVYRLDAMAGDSLRIHFRSVTTDGSVYIVTDCADPINTCVAGMDETVDGEFENLAYMFPSSGTYYLILDSVLPNSSSNWVANGLFRNPLTDVSSGPGAGLSLQNISPNPFRGRTSLLYELPAREHVSLRIYDLQGRVLRTLVDALTEPGQHQTIWDGRDDRGQRIGAGVYFARLASGTREVVGRMVFVE